MSGHVRLPLLRTQAPKEQVKRQMWQQRAQEVWQPQTLRLFQRCRR